MNCELTRLWNETVSSQDTVIYLGDFSLNPKLVKDILPHLNGTKYLIPGNHDKAFSGKERWRYHYLQAGFTPFTEHDPFPKQANFTIEKRQVRLSHLPYRDFEAEDQRYSELRPINDGQWLLCGHVHTSWKVKDRQINVGVDQWGFKPVSLEQIQEIIENAIH